MLYSSGFAPLQTCKLTVNVNTNTVGWHNKYLKQRMQSMVYLVFCHIKSFYNDGKTYDNIWLNNRQHIKVN